MPTLSPGDKVKFLNTSGGGIVTKVIDSRMVSVMIEAGFEIPTMISELIRIDPKEPAARFFEEHYDIHPVSQPDAAEEVADDRLFALPSHLSHDRKSEEIFLAFVPHDQKWLITGPIDIFLINNSTFDVLYNIFSKTPAGHYNGIDYGSIFPESKLLLATINREQLIQWTEGSLQFLFHKEQTKTLLPPFNSEFRVDGKRFYKEGNYRENPVVQAKAVVVKVLSLTEYFLSEAQDIHEAAPIRPIPAELQPIITRHRVAPFEAEVDLHIHELLDDPVNLEKSEILEFQKSYFLKCLDSAIANHFQKVIFIHGVGNGILKSSLQEMLKKQEGIEFFDAPMVKYGAGALEIRILQRG